MEILRGASDLDLIIAQAAQTVCYRRNTLGQHRRIRHHQSVSLEPLPVLPHEIPQTYAADFFLSLNHDFHVYGELPTRCAQCFKRLQMNVDLPLIICCPSTVKVSIADGRFKG